MKKAKFMLRMTSLILSVVVMLTVLPMGAFATDIKTTPQINAQSAAAEAQNSTEISATQEYVEGEMLAGVESIDTSMSESEDLEPLAESELATIIKNGKMDRITADNVPDAVGFESAKAKNHVARAYEKEKDELNTLVFLNEDGTYTKYVYDYPVKFTDENGEIKDTSLEIVSDTKGGYQTMQGGTFTSFSEKMTDGISLSGDGVSVSLVPRQQVTVRPEPNLSQMASKKLNGLLQSTEKVNSLDNKTVSYYYDNSTTIEYSLTYMGFKEDIVVSEYTGQTEYVFTLKTNGLTLVEDDGNFYLADSEGNSKVSLGQVIIFTADERNNTFGSMTAETVIENQEYTVTLHVDADWLKDENTLYPIRIDPTLELVNQGDSLVEDVVINSDNTISHRTTEALKVGKNEDGTYSRILIKFNYDFGSFADGPLKIHRAYVEMRDLMCQPESMTVMSEMYVGTNWGESSDWSMIARGVHTHYMASMPIKQDKGVSLAEPHRYSISILDAMKYWVAEANNTPDYYQASPQGGIMIKAYDEVEQGNTAITKYFGSSQHATSAYRPSLSVTYYDQHTQYSDPFGHLDAVTSNSIRGWVWCVDLPDQSVPVSIYLTNQTTGEAWPGIFLSGKATSLHRPDVETAGYGSGCYGFNYPIDWSEYSAGKYTVTVKWHSMNGTTLQANLFNAPREYENVGVRLSETEVSLDIGDMLSLSATSFINGTSNHTVTWSVENSDILEYSSLTGKYLARSSGITNLTATTTDGNYSASCEVWVRGKTPVFLIHGRTSNSKSVWGIENAILPGDNNEFDSNINATSLNGKKYTDIESQRITGVLNNPGGTEKPVYLGRELKDAGYEENINLFVFNYPNEDAVVHSSQKFEVYINNLISYTRTSGTNKMKACFYASRADYEAQNHKINLVGHSMGGLVSRYYIENLGHDNHVDKLITICTPHWGSGYADLSNETGISHSLCDHDLDFDSAMYGGDLDVQLECTLSKEQKYTFTGELLFNKSRTTKYYAIAGVDYPPGQIMQNDYCFDMPTGYTTYQQVADFMIENKVYRYTPSEFNPKMVGDNMVGLMSQIGWTENSGKSPNKQIQIEKIFIDVDCNGGNGGGVFILEILPDGSNIFHSKVPCRQPVCNKTIDYLKE